MMSHVTRSHDTALVVPKCNGTTRRVKCSGKELMIGCWSKCNVTQLPYKNFQSLIQRYCYCKMIDISLSSNAYIQRRHWRITTEYSLYLIHPDMIQNYYLKKNIDSMSIIKVAWLDKRLLIQWNLSVTTTSIIKVITCDLFSNLF